MNRTQLLLCILALTIGFRLGMFIESRTTEELNSDTMQTTPSITVGSIWHAQDEKSGLKSPIQIRAVDTSKRLVTYRQYFESDPEWNGPVDYSTFEDFLSNYRR